MSSRTQLKIVIFIVLVLIWLWGLSVFPAPMAIGTALGDSLKAWYDGYNMAYFGNSLPKDTVIDYTTSGINVAVTSRFKDGRFHIAFNPKSASSPMFAHLILLHETCHIRTWDEVKEHGPRWEVCMGTLEREGAFHRELVTQFTEAEETK